MLPSWAKFWQVLLFLAKFQEYLFLFIYLLSYYKRLSKPDSILTSIVLELSYFLLLKSFLSPHKWKPRNLFFVINLFGKLLIKYKSTESELYQKHFP